MHPPRQVLLRASLAVAPVGFVLMMVRLKPDTTNAGRARRAAIVASIIAVYFVLLNASYAYWEGGWSYGPRHAAPAIPFLCIGLAALWTALPRFVRPLLAALSIYGVAITLVAVSTTPQPPASLHAPVRELLWPAFRDGVPLSWSRTVPSTTIPGPGAISNADP